MTGVIYLYTILRNPQLLITTLSQKQAKVGTILAMQFLMFLIMLISFLFTAVYSDEIPNIIIFRSCFFNKAIRSKSK